MKSANSTIYANFVAAQEIVRHGKLSMDGEYMKDSFIKISEHLIADFKNKRDASLCEDCQRQNHRNGVAV